MSDLINRDEAITRFKRMRSEIAENMHSDYAEHNEYNEGFADALDYVIALLSTMTAVEAIHVERIQSKIDMLEQNIDSGLSAPAMFAQLHELVSLKRLVTDWEKEHWTKILGEKEE